MDKKKGTYEGAGRELDHKIASWEKKKWKKAFILVIG